MTNDSSSSVGLLLVCIGFGCPHSYVVLYEICEEYCTYSYYDFPLNIVLGGCGPKCRICRGQVYLKQVGEGPAKRICQVYHKQVGEGPAKRPTRMYGTITSSTVVVVVGV
jgi:hypothetical protein